MFDEEELFRSGWRGRTGVEGLGLGWNEDGPELRLAREAEEGKEGR